MNLTANNNRAPILGCSQAYQTTHIHLGVTFQEAKFVLDRRQVGACQHQSAKQQRVATGDSGLSLVAKICLTGKQRLLADVDMRVFGVAREGPALRDVVDEYQRYAAHMHQHRASIATLVRPVLGLFHGAPGARRWRRYLSEQITVKHFTPTILGDALAAMDQAAEQVATAA